MGALLLPRSLVENVLEGTLEVRGLLGMRVLLERNHEPAILLIAEIFDVNPIVARYRLDALYPPAAEQQLTL
jgi:hypothetical protein